MRRHGFTLVQLVIVVVLLLIVAAVLFPVFARRRENDGNRSCSSNLRQIALGIKQYMQDYDERMPLVSNKTKGWTDVLQPYIKTWRVFQCPSTNNSNQQHITDYFYNARLSGISEANIDSVSLTLALGDGPDNGEANSNLWELPFDWVNSPNVPSHRHLDGAFYAFADGHVKWVKPSKITAQPVRAGVPTFAIE